MNSFTKDIASIANVSLEEALKIQEIIDNQWLIRWTSCSKAGLTKAIKIAQAYMGQVA
jgi:hypothetical protein